MRKWNVETINRGDAVYGSDSRKIGSIDYCEEEYCKVDMDSPSMECYVPSSCIEDVQPGAVFLRVPGDRIGQMGWERPPKRVAGGGRREVVRARDTESREPSPEGEIGESEPM